MAEQYRWEQEPARRLTTLQLEGRGVPRHGYPVLATGPDDAGAGAPAVARLTSGAFSPTLRVGIALAYLPTSLSRPGTALAVEVRRRTVPAPVVRRPFYRRAP